MKAATIRTIFGYLASLGRKLGPLDLSGEEIDDIYNYRRISEQISTSGQPTEKQFEAIKAAGFETVINLAPHSHENALADEAGTLAALGMTYIHIPVDFKAPTWEDFDRFALTLKNLGDAPVWVHCAANMRVSAFIYLYRTVIFGEDAEIAKKDLHAIWEPFGAWKEFIRVCPDKANNQS